MYSIPHNSMVTQMYDTSFDQSVQFFIHSTTPNKLQYRRHGILDQLLIDANHDLLRAIITDPKEDTRLQAVRKLGQYGNDNFAVEVLNRVVNHDPSLELREAAKLALVQILQRLQ